MPSLFDPVTLGALALKNRVVMAPMTRSRADQWGVQPDYAADYYAQRAGAGLIITEGTFPSLGGQGYARTPGIATDAQIAAWKHVTDAVHAKGGQIVCQIMHAGRAAHTFNRKTHDPILAPSAIAASGSIYTDQAGMQPMPTPKAMDENDIQQAIADYAQAARNAVMAGFDGVEFHCASGYLPNQFLAPNANLRTDRYGGSAENRARFAHECLEAMGQAIGFDRIGIKISPDMTFNDIQDPDPVSTYSALLAMIDPLGLAYLHVGKFGDALDVHAAMRPLWRGAYLAGGGFHARADGENELARTHSAAVVYGTLFIANPDLVDRLKNDYPLADADKATFYTPGPKGYTDYPSFQSVQAA